MNWLVWGLGASCQLLNGHWLVHYFPRSLSLEYLGGEMSGELSQKYLRIVWGII